MDEVREASRVFPQEIASAVGALAARELASVEELRLRIGRKPTYLIKNREYLLSCGAITSKHLQETVDRAAESSVYAVQEMLKNGFLTLRGGHRLGLCGRGVYRHGELVSLREISSVDLRIARPLWGVADEAVNFLWTHPFSTLILAPPGRGKTTLLRDLIRQISDRFGWRIGVADERMELAACLDGVPQFFLGRSTDVLTGVRKAEAIEMLLRSISPEWIAVDEITAEEDVRAISRASYCGVRFLATAHAATVKELRQRPIYAELLAAKAFRNAIVIDPMRNLQTEVLSND